MYIIRVHIRVRNFVAIKNKTLRVIKRKEEKRNF